MIDATPRPARRPFPMTMTRADLALAALALGTVATLAAGLMFVSTPDHSVAVYAWPGRAFAFYAPLAAIAAFGMLFACARMTEKGGPSHASPVILWSGLSGTLLLLLFYSPIYSQDVYQHLALAHGWAGAGQNPYLSSVEASPSHPFKDYVLAWREAGMHLGALWTVFVGLFAKLDLSAPLTLALMRLVAIGTLAWSGLMLKGLMERQGFSSRRIRTTLILLACTPLVLVDGIVDLHPEVFLLPFLVGALSETERGRYSSAALLLVAGSFIKYFPAFLIPIPLFMALREGGIRAMGKAAIAAMLAVLAGLSVTVALFGTSAVIPSGLLFNASAASWSFSGFGTFVLMRAADAIADIPFTETGPMLKWGSLVFILAASAVLGYKQRPLDAFTWPLLVSYMCFLPWYFPWYLLSLLPFLVLRLPLPTIAIILIAAPLAGLPGGTPAVSFLLLAGYGTIALIKWVRRDRERAILVT